MEHLSINPSPRKVKEVSHEWEQLGGGQFSVECWAKALRLLRCLKLVTRLFMSVGFWNSSVAMKKVRSV